MTFLFSAILLASAILFYPVLQANAVDDEPLKDAPVVTGEEQVVDTGKPATGGTIGGGGNPFGSGSPSGGGSAPTTGGGTGSSQGSGLKEAKPPPSASKPDAGTTGACKQGRQSEEARDACDFTLSKPCLQQRYCTQEANAGWKLYQVKGAWWACPPDYPNITNSGTECYKGKT